MQAYRATNPMAGDSLSISAKSDLKRISKEHSAKACAEGARIKGFLHSLIKDKS